MFVLQRSFWILGFTFQACLTNLHAYRLGKFARTATSAVRKGRPEFQGFLEGPPAEATGPRRPSREPGDEQIHFETTGPRRPSRETGEKQITFIRHGESLGNLLASNPVKYALEAGKHRHTAWKDSVLSKAGKKRAIARVNKLDDTLVDRILDSEVVLVSPLMRAMETCIIILAEAIKRKTGGLLLLDKMRFVVMSDLREKLLSDSEKPGAGNVDIEQHLTKVAKQHGDWNVPIIKKMIEAYRQEELRTNKFEVDPDNAERFLTAITRSRATIESLPESRILIVGHSGWSRWTFATDLKGACLNDPTNTRLHHVAFGGRQVQPLANLGMVTAQFAQQKFNNVVVHDAEEGTCKKTKFALFPSIQEAKDAHIIPEDAIVHRLFIQRTPRRRGAGYKERWVTFSATGWGHSMLAWGGGMAEPKKLIHLNLAKQTSKLKYDLKYACDFEEEALYVSSSAKSISALRAKDMTVTTVRPFRLVTSLGKESTPASRVNFKRLCLLMRVHTKFGSDASFIAKVFEETRWNEAKSEADLDVLLTQGLSTWEEKWRRTSRVDEMFRVEEVTDLAAIKKLRGETGTKKSWR